MQCRKALHSITVSAVASNVLYYRHVQPERFLRLEVDDHLVVVGYCTGNSATWTAKLGLVVTGISLRRTPKGRWVCCEVNPSPGFTVYQ